MMLRVTKNDVRGAYRYYGLFYTRPDRVLSKMYILRTDRADESVLCRDSADGQWCETERDGFLRFMTAGSPEGDLSEMSEQDALWFLEREQAFNGEGDDEAVEAFLGMWTEKKERFRDEWENGGGWPAKYVETTFYLKGKQYSITPDRIGLEEGESWDEGFMEYLQSEIGADLRALGAEEIRHIGFLD